MRLLLIFRSTGKKQIDYGPLSCYDGQQLVSQVFKFWQRAPDMPHESSSLQDEQPVGSAQALHRAGAWRTHFYFYASSQRGFLMRRSRAFSFFAMLLLLVCAIPVFADVINLSYNTFGGYSSTNPSGVSPPTAAEGTVSSTSQSASLTTNSSNDQVGALYMDTILNTTANALTLKFDIEILAQAATGYAQNFGGSQTLGGVRIYQSPAWAVSFQLMPTSATTGYFGFRNEANTSVVNLGSYTVGTTHHIRIDVDYVNNLASGYINGSLAGTSPLRTGNVAGGTTSEIFVYLNGATGSANAIRISETALAPPAAVPALNLWALSLLSMLTAALGAVWWGRRVRPTAPATRQPEDDRRCSAER